MTYDQIIKRLQEIEVQVTVVEDILFKAKQVEGKLKHFKTERAGLIAVLGREPTSEEMTPKEVQL